MSDLQKQFGEYDFLEEIGSGAFGKVLKIRLKSKNQFCACKEIEYGTMTEKEKALLVSEVNILRELKHPNIVKYYDRIIDKKKCKIYIIMEYCDGGDLGAIIKKCKDTNTYVDEEVIWKILCQLLLALNECHNHCQKTEKGICRSRVLHRDIKPRNIFLNRDKVAKLGDFGLARCLNENSLAKTSVGTPYYLSPEQAQDRPYDEKSDIWALGCVIFELAALSPPFTANNQLSLYEKIKRDPIPTLPRKYSYDLQSIINRMMDKNPYTRPSAEELINTDRCVVLRLREMKVVEYANSVKEKEEELKRKEEELNIREQRIREKEAALRNTTIYSHPSSSSNFGKINTQSSFQQYPSNINMNLHHQQTHMFSNENIPIGINQQHGHFISQPNNILK